MNQLLPKTAKCTSVLLGLMCSFFMGAVAQPLAGVKKILILGNSITYAGGYVTALETYMTLTHPDAHFEFMNTGLPSETVSGLSEEGHAGGKFPRPDLHERLDRVLAITKPDLVFACYGMNDGIYLPFGEDRFLQFKNGINWLHDQVTARGIKIVHVTPPVFDELKGGHPGYAAVLDRYSDWLLGQRTAAKWEVADLHYPMKKYLEAHRKLDAKLGINGTFLAADGVHPGEVGHWIMARSILVYLGEKITGGDLLSSVNHPKKQEILKLVTQKQAIMKDAWLTAAGHKRPGMNTGLPLDEAQKKAAEIDRQIAELMTKQ